MKAWGQTRFSAARKRDDETLRGGLATPAGVLADVPRI